MIFRCDGLRHRLRSISLEHDGLRPGTLVILSGQGHRRTDYFGVAGRTIRKYRHDEYRENHENNSTNYAFFESSIHNLSVSRQLIIDEIVWAKALRREYSNVR